ncbi:MAG: 4Fe-4S dicluster domain-containing protein [Candidatus Pacearchaeota archaeon]
MQKILPKSKLKEFIESLMNSYEIIAPVNKDITKFDIIKNPNEIYLKQITKVPLKKFFIPENEIILEYENEIIKEKKDKTKERVIFGLRKCDINALEILDKVMTDKFYLNKRKKSILIGYFCENPDKYCFCNSMQLSDKGFDLFFYPKDNFYFISIGTEKGKELVKNLKTAKKEIKLEYYNRKYLKETDLNKHYKDKIWEENANQCLSCSACTIYCPTCNCFDINDILSLNLKDGKRIRQETSCHLKSFTEVAGEKYFRESRLARFKHFVYHKIVYYKKKKGRYMCVGCGRCLRVCPTKIDWVKTINLLESIKHPIEAKEKII